MEGYCPCDDFLFPPQPSGRQPGAPSRHLLCTLSQKYGRYCAAGGSISYAHLPGGQKLISLVFFLSHETDACKHGADSLFPCHGRLFCHVFCAAGNLIIRHLRIRCHADIHRKDIYPRPLAHNGSAAASGEEIFRHDSRHFLACLSHALRDDSIVRAQDHQSLFTELYIRIPGYPGNLDNGILKLS